jgi:hypothetical protein
VKLQLGQKRLQKHLALLDTLEERSSEDPRAKTNRSVPYASKHIAKKRLPFPLKTYFKPVTIDQLEISKNWINTIKRTHPVQTFR